jgi:multidrug efflux pump
MIGVNLSDWALRHRSLVAYFMIVAVIAGVLSYFRLGRNEDPAFIIKTMVVQAAWPGATVEETTKQVTERLERQLQETPHLDFLRSFTRAGVTTIFVNLKGSASAKEVADTWYQVRKNIGDIRHTLPAGVVGPGFNDDFGDTFGIIYVSPATASPSANCATMSRISAPNFFWCPMYRKSKCWAPKMKLFSSNFRNGSLPPSGSIGPR